MDTLDRDYEPCPECGVRVDMTDPRQIARHKAPGHVPDAAPVPGLDRGGLIENNDHAEELGNFATCAACGQTYNMRVGAEVLHHEEPGHQPLLPVV
jgi:hypothetical protein